MVMVQCPAHYVYVGSCPKLLSNTATLGYPVAGCLEWTPFLPPTLCSLELAWCLQDWLSKALNSGGWRGRRVEPCSLLSGCLARQPAWFFHAEENETPRGWRWCYPPVDRGRFLHCSTCRTHLGPCQCEGTKQPRFAVIIFTPKIFRCR